MHYALRCILALVKYPGKIDTYLATQARLLRLFQKSAQLARLP